MKKLTLLAIITALIAAMPLAAADRDFDSMVPDPDHTFGKGLLRGLANISCAIIELPARTTYYSCLYSWNYIPYGLPMGILDGSNYTVIRLVGGVSDLLFLGSNARNHTLYTLFEIPTMPWDSPWLPTEEERKEIEW
ncbi:hypothetical protein J6U76_01050 [bacterium]|jgi:hypothetical protein|nr:hypothetical protein [bacterium]